MHNGSCRDHSHADLWSLPLPSCFSLADCQSSVADCFREEQFNTLLSVWFFSPSNFCSEYIIISSLYDYVIPCNIRPGCVREVWDKCFSKSMHFLYGKCIETLPQETLSLNGKQDKAVVFVIHTAFRHFLGNTCFLVSVMYEFWFEYFIISNAFWLLQYYLYKVYS